MENEQNLEPAVGVLNIADATTIAILEAPDARSRLPRAAREGESISIREIVRLEVELPRPADADIDEARPLGLDLGAAAQPGGRRGSVCAGGGDEMAISGCPSSNAELGALFASGALAAGDKLVGVDGSRVGTRDELESTLDHIYMFTQKGIISVEIEREVESSLPDGIRAIEVATKAMRWVLYPTSRPGAAESLSPAAADAIIEKWIDELMAASSSTLTVMPASFAIEMQMDRWERKSTFWNTLQKSQ